MAQSLLEQFGRILSIVFAKFPQSSSCQSNRQNSPVTCHESKQTESKLRLTFGVELECVFAFHESLLQSHLDKMGDDSKIRKDIPEEIRSDLQHQLAPRYLKDRSQYMGWGLTGPTNYSDGEIDSYYQDCFDLRLRTHGYRAYGGEVLHIAKEILPSSVQIHDNFHLKRSDFSQWHLTHDSSLTGVCKDLLSANLPALSASDVQSWDNHPIELVSRTLPYHSSSFEEINNHLSHLKGSPNSSHTALLTQHCGMHIHIGLPIPPNHPPGEASPTFKLPTIQHLAYILVRHESAISTLHPTRRRARSPTAHLDLQTNLDNFLDEPDHPASSDDNNTLGIDPKPLHDQQTTIPSPPPAAAPPALNLQKARRQIFSPETTIASLSALLSGPDLSKSHIVNWSYLSRTNGLARTLEFRQHEGCLDGEAVRRWVEFLVCLVGVGEEMGGRDPGGEEWGDEGGRGLGALFELMEMGGEARAYWMGRVEAFREEEEDEEA